MKSRSPMLVCSTVLTLSVATAHAQVPDFGAKARGSELSSGTVEDGGPGSSSASISQANFNADANFVATSTYLPELTAFSRNTTASNDDDITASEAEAYEVFSSSVTQTIDLNVSLHGIVVDGSIDTSGVLADVFVYGGASFEVTDTSICPDGSLGRFTFDGVYFCGTRLGRANLFIPAGDVTLSQVLTFDVAAGGTFGVYGTLLAISSDGSADATQTLSLGFADDEFIRPVTIPDTGAMTVNIDIKPGSDTNAVNPRSKGKIPVAILTTSTADGDPVDSDAWDVDPSTLAFGPNGAGISHAQGHAEDVDGDGDLDMVVHFKTRHTGIACGDTEAVLTGATFGGQAVQGTDSIKTSGCKGATTSTIIISGTGPSDPLQDRVKDRAALRREKR